MDAKRRWAGPPGAGRGGGGRGPAPGRGRGGPSPHKRPATGAGPSTGAAELPHAARPTVGGDEQEDAPDYGAPAEMMMDDDADGGGGGPLEDVDLELGEAGRNWERPALTAPLDPSKDDIGEKRAR